MARGITRSELGATVRAERLARGLSQRELAERSTLHPSYLSGIEGGTRNPTWITLGMLADGLGMPLSQLVLAVEALSATKP